MVHSRACHKAMKLTAANVGRQFLFVFRFNPALIYQQESLLDPRFENSFISDDSRRFDCRWIR
jgi:hypothetical protein